MDDKKTAEAAEKELQQLHSNWGQAEKQAADRTLWKTLVSAVCANGHEED